MEEFENNEIDEELKNDDQEEKSYKEEDNYILAKDIPSESGKNGDYFLKQSRFTTIKNDFSEEDESIRSSSIPSKENENPSEKNDINENDHNNKIGKQNRKTRYSNKNIIELKLILLGDIAVGKTSILSRYINNEFKENYQCTINAEFKTKFIDVDLNTSVQMKIWDTIGQEKYRNVTRQYYHGSDGALIIFDLSNKNSFEYVPKWIEDLKDNGPKDISILILGNKSDLTLEREVNMDEIKKFIGNKYLYYEVSAKNGNNISLAFDKIRNQIMEELKKNKKLNKKDDDIRLNMNPRDSKDLDTLGKSVEKSSKCC